MVRGSARRGRRAKAVVCAVAAAALAVTAVSWTNKAADARVARGPEAPRASSTPLAPANRGRPPEVPSLSPRARLAGPLVLAESGAKQPGLVLHPSKAQGKRELAVMLHGMCDEPEVECPYFAGSTREHGWLLCPRATLRCDGGGSIWRFSDFEQGIEAAVERAAESQAGEFDVEQGRTLIGFSLGALRGMDLAHRGAGKWSRVILIGAKVHPDEKKLRAAGVERLLLAAGEYDMMRGHMAAQAARLARRGYPAAFLSLGKHGHWFPPDMDERMRRALAWVHGDDQALDAKPAPAR